MANISAIKLPNGTTYDLKDNGALQLTGGQVTGPVTFGDSISVDEATIGDLVVNGNASFTNNIQANTINGIPVDEFKVHFICTVTDNTYYSCTCDKTEAAILAAYNANQKINTVLSVIGFNGNNFDINMQMIVSSFNGETDISFLGFYAFYEFEVGLHLPYGATSDIVTINIQDLTIDEHVNCVFSESNSTQCDIALSLTGGKQSLLKSSGVSVAQYRNSSGSYRRLILGSTIVYTEPEGGSYGTIRLYGTGAAYYGDLNPGTIGSNSLTANRTWTLPDKTGIIALTSDIPTVPSNIVNTITTTAGAHTAITSQKGNVSFNVPTTAAHVGAASSSHTHGNITNGGDITATAPTIASGDQLIINDHSASKITNGPTFDGSTTTTALTPKGTWETFSKFSGSYNDLSDKPTQTSTTATLTTTWSSNQQSVTVSGVTTSNTIIVTPAPASYDAYCEAGIYCSAQAANSLTFKCSTVPASSLTVNIMILE